MRGSDWLVGFVALLGGGLASTVGACVSNEHNCENYPVDGCAGVGTTTSSGSGGTGTGGTGTGGTGTGGTGTGGSTPASCIPNEDPKVAVDDSCGVFLSATGDDTSAGSKDAPVKTFAAAIALAKGKTDRIYVCAESFTDDVILSAGIEVYGGLDCAMMPRAWTWAGDTTKTSLIATAAAKIALTLDKGSGTLVADLHVKALAGTANGESSIAVIADKVSATIQRSTFEAAAGATGDAGQTFGNAAQGGVDGEKGGDACSAVSVNGGNPVMGMCGMPDSVSGNGGQGFSASAGKGGDGTPGGSPNGGTADSGAGCEPGTGGALGSTGNPGPGATGTGSITNKGYAGVTGGNGLVGGPGQGGGGGGGRIGGSGATKCMGATTGGAAGGSGGSGGCGGNGGNGGKSGGSSIGLVSIDSTLTFANVTLISANGGNGGNGGPGQHGGSGGMGGPGGDVPASATSLIQGCSGGPGGIGGDGGKGGGGTGGHSLAIAFTGKAPPASSGNTWMATTGTAGDGGQGDTSNGNLGNGAPGVKGEMQLFQ